jgi:hypothetical protein
MKTIKAKMGYLLAFLLLTVAVFAGGCSNSTGTEDTGNSTKVDFSYEINTSVEESTEVSAETGDSEVITVGDVSITEDGEYTSKEEVAAYIHTFGKLPSNYITKKQAKRLGWGSDAELDEVAPGKSIGGDKFGNREGNLPEAEGRTYQECDIDYEGGARNAKRIIFSNDGYIFYTDDHYATFEQLYGED